MCVLREPGSTGMYAKVKITFVPFFVQYVQVRETVRLP